MIPPIDPFDNRVSRSFQLILETAFDQPSEDGCRRRFAMKPKAAHVRVAAQAANGLMHSFDNVAAHAEIPQPRL
jgi:hypothetical protein